MSLCYRRSKRGSCRFRPRQASRAALKRKSARAEARGAAKSTGKIGKCRGKAEKPFWREAILEGWKRKGGFFRCEEKQQNLLGNVVENFFEIAGFDEIAFIDDILAEDGIIAPTEGEAFEFVAERG